MEWEKSSPRRRAQVRARPLAKSAAATPTPRLPVFALALKLRTIDLKT